MSSLCRLFMLTLFIGSAHATAAQGDRVSTTVILFGTNCQIEGKASSFGTQNRAEIKNYLDTIHAFSPSQLTRSDETGQPRSPESLAQVNNVMSRIQAASTLPPSVRKSFEPYLTPLQQWAAGWMQFYEAFDKNRSTPDEEALAANLARAIQSGAGRSDKRPSDLASIDTLKKRFKTNGLSGAAEAFEGMIVPQPQDEFHRIIRRLSIVYDCNLDHPGN